MSANCRVNLPNNVKVRDVANAIGILAGLKPQERPILGSDGFFYHVPGVKVEHAESMPECARILLKAPEGETLVDGEQSHFALFHFEWETPTDNPDINESSKGIMPPSTPFWALIGKALVDVFGGSIDYNDCDDVDSDYAQTADPLNGARNGLAWDQQQHRLFNLQPIKMQPMPEAAYR